jgi:hypothetical protein
MMKDWIWEENLEAFVQVTARLAAYSSFDEDDWAAIQFGIRDTDVERDLWYEYSLPGVHSIKLKFARDIGTSVVFVCVEGDRELDGSLELVTNLCQDYRILPRHS